MRRVAMRNPRVNDCAVQRVHRVRRPPNRVRQLRRLQVHFQRSVEQATVKRSHRHKAGAQAIELIG